MGRLYDPPDYGHLFDHVSRLKVVVILTTPRAGSDFFQSLLDGHPQVVQVPGQFQFYRFWENALCRENLMDLIHEFVWDRRHLGKFNSRYETAERWHCLGDGKDEHFTVDVADFEEHLRSIMAGRALTSRNFFLAVHVAYSLAAGMPDLSQTQVLVCHLHEPYSLPPFHEDFPEYDVVFCTRDPRSALVSTVENIMAAYGQMDLRFFRFWLRWIVMDAEQVIPYTRRIKALPLERLHCASEQVWQELCRDFGIEFHPSLLESTWAGKRWWGDARSKRFLSGFNPRIREPSWEGKLSRFDVLALERLLADRMAQHGHACTVRPKSWRWLLAPCFFWLPMRYEWQIAKVHVQRQGSLARQALAAAEALCEYIARVRFSYGYFWRGLRGRVFVARAVGDPASSERPERQRVASAALHA